MVADTNTPTPQDQSNNIEDRISRLEVAVETLVARVDAQQSTSAQSDTDRHGRTWRESATQSFGAANDGLRGIFHDRPVAAAIGLAVAAVVLIQILD